MIVTCPGCASKYRVRNEAVPSEGARMRCPKCETLFLAKPPVGEDATDDAMGALASLAPSGSGAPQPAPAPAPVFGNQSAQNPPRPTFPPQPQFPPQPFGAPQFPPQPQFPPAPQFAAPQFPPQPPFGAPQFPPQPQFAAPQFNPQQPPAFPPQPPPAFPPQPPPAFPPQQPSPFSSAPGRPPSTPQFPAPTFAAPQFPPGFAAPPQFPPQQPPAFPPQPAAPPSPPSSPPLFGAPQPSPFGAGFQAPSPATFGGPALPPAPAAPKASGPVTALFGAIDDSMLPPEARATAQPQAARDPFAGISLEIDTGAPAAAPPPPHALTERPQPPVRPVASTPPYQPPPAPRRAPGSLVREAAAWLAVVGAGAFAVLGLLVAGWTSEAIDLDETFLPIAEQQLGVTPVRSATGTDLPDLPALKVAASAAEAKGDLASEAVLWRRIQRKAPQDRQATAQIPKVLTELGEKLDAPSL